MVLLILLVLFVGVDMLERPLANPDEGRYSEIAREMALSGDWVTPRLNGYKYFEKPPLQYWATAATFRLFGENEYTARLYTALCGVLAILAVAFTMRRLASARTAALDAIDLLLRNDALPMSAAKTKAGQASRFDEVTAAIDKLTVEYFFDSATGRKLVTVADAGSKESRVAELPAAEPTKGAAPAQSETEAGDEPPQEDGDDSTPPEDDDKF